MKKLIIVSIATISLFAGIKVTQNSQNTLAYQWFSSAIAGTCAESTADACGSRDTNDEYRSDNCRACTATGGNGGSNGSGGGSRSGSGGTRGDRDNQEERQQDTSEEATQNRPQCIANSTKKLKICNAGPKSLHLTTIRGCSNFDFTSQVGASAGFRVFLDVSGSTSVTVRSFDKCKAVADSLKEALLNDCEVADATRITQCPAE